MKTKPFRFIDLFAGLGGFHLALDRLGGACVFAAEWKENLRGLYETNFGLRPAGDITLVAPQSIPDHDVLTAGFPCQPFSKAGEQLGFECTKQGGLFFNVEEILRQKKPRFFILENVPNLLKHDQGKTWEKIQKLLGHDGLGYHIDAAKFSPHNFGIPQIRERIYIVGSLKPLTSFIWPKTTDVETSIDSVLDGYPADAKILSPQVRECLDVWDVFLKTCPKEVILPSFPLWSMEWGATYPFENETPYACKVCHGADGFKGIKGSHGRKLGYMRNIENIWAALPSHARTEQIEFPTWKKISSGKIGSSMRITNHGLTHGCHASSSSLPAYRSWSGMFRVASTTSGSTYCSFVHQVCVLNVAQRHQVLSQ